MESNFPPLPSPLAPNPLLLFVNLLTGSLFGEKGEKNLVIFSDHTFPKQKACS